MMKKTVPKILLYKFLVLSSLLVACSNATDTEKTEEATGNESVGLFLDYTSLQEITLVGKESVSLSYTSEGWVESEGKTVDQEVTDNLFSELIQLTGTMMDKNEAEKINAIEPFLDLALVNGENEEVTVQLIEDEAGVMYATYNGEEVYQIHQLPEEFQQFSLIMLQSPLALNSEEFKEIHYADAKSVFVLNQETALSEVETSPFISGWFLHSDLQTEFSVEYNQMEQLLLALTSLKGEISETVEEEAFLDPIQIDLKGSEKEETLLIGSQVESEDYTYVKTESNQTVYQVPNVLVNKLQLDPTTLIDNFISLLPLTAIDSIEITEGHTVTLIEAEHEVVENEEEELEIVSEFYVNTAKVDAETFRKTYQYLAMLSYEEALNGYEIPTEVVEGEINIVYSFKNDASILQNHIRLIPYPEGQYAVVKNNIAEFTTSVDQVNTMLQQVSFIVPE